LLKSLLSNSLSLEEEGWGEVQVTDISPPHLTSPPQGGEEELVIGQAVKSGKKSAFTRYEITAQSNSRRENLFHL
jgi:hypothetical protein